MMFTKKSSLDVPRGAEPLAVTLVRVESKVGSILERVEEMHGEVSQHSLQINILSSAMQQVQSDALSAAKALVDADKGRADTARALKDADEARVAAAKAQVDNTTQKWSPTLRLSVIFGTVFAGLGVIASFALLAYYITHPHG